MVNLTVSDETTGHLPGCRRQGDRAARRLTTPPAKLWLDFGVTRSVVKRQTMTFGYGSNLFGLEQLKDDLMKPLANDVMKGRIDVHPFGDDDGYQAANFMAKHVWKAVNDVIFKAAEGMAYFKALADICSKDGKLMAWTTPLNFPVYHRYDQMVGQEDQTVSPRSGHQCTQADTGDCAENATRKPISRRQIGVRTGAQ